MGRSDELLALRATRGDRRAFDAIYRRYSPQLYRFCLAMTGNPQDAQEALQNTMVKVLRALPGERREIKLKPWLYRIARNESIEARRRRRPGAKLDSKMAALGDVEETVATRERLRALLIDLAALPERQRATVVMREVAGLEFAEIALAFGTSQGAVRQALYEARLRLRELESRRELGWDEEIERRSEDLAALAPLSAVGAIGGAGKAVASSALLKLAGTVAATVAIVAVADRSGLVNLPVGAPNRTAKAAGDRARVVSRISSSLLTGAPASGKGQFAGVGTKSAPGAASPSSAGLAERSDTALPESREADKPLTAGGDEPAADSAKGSPLESTHPASTEGEPDSTVSHQPAADDPPEAESRSKHGHGPPGGRPGPPADPPGRSKTKPGRPSGSPGRSEAKGKSEAPGKSDDHGGSPAAVAPPEEPQQEPPDNPKSPHGKPEAPPGKSGEAPGRSGEAPETGEPSRS